MGLLVGLLAIALIIFILSAMATGLGTILGLLYAILVPKNRKPRLDPNRSRSIEEIEWDKTHRYPMPTRR